MFFFSSGHAVCVRDFAIDSFTCLLSHWKSGEMSSAGDIESVALKTATEVDCATSKLFAYFAKVPAKNHKLKLTSHLCTNYSVHSTESYVKSPACVVYFSVHHEHYSPKISHLQNYNWKFPEVLRKASLH